MHFKEIESKYDAEGISMQKFMELAQTLKPTKELLVSSYDDFFVDENNNFIRYRYNDQRGELTIKRKTSDKNNNERIEVNLPTQGNNFKAVEAFSDLLGYKYNFGIYKTCQIYWVPQAVIVYYVVYDKEMKELRRFIEVEADEECTWDSEQQAWDKVTEYEKVLETLGITARNRLKKSLFEMFRKENPKT